MAAKLLEQGMHFSEFSSGKINPTELIALLINQGQTFVEGIEHMYKEIKGSCSLLLLTEDGIIAARDSWGRTPVVVGKKEGAYAVTGESTAFPNLDYETVLPRPRRDCPLQAEDGVFAPSAQAHASLFLPLGVLRFPLPAMRVRT